MTTTVARPFLKWAGGKRQLLTQILALIPKQIRTYYEPFVGGGAVFFALAAEGRFQRAVLNDASQELMDCFQAVRSFPQDTVAQLGHWPIDETTFMAVRALDPATLSPARRGARLIYLNKTGFNGLYRVNKKGEFNVPYGKWEHPPTIVDPINLQACSEVLNRYATLYCQDFVGAVSDAGPGDAVYFDPPYLPVSATANFQNYTTNGFGLDDHHRLAACFRELINRDVTVVVSSSDTETTRSLYHGFEMNEIRALRSINSRGDRRGPVRELIIASQGRSALPVY